MVDNGNRVAGTWRITGTLPDATTFKAVIVFTSESNVFEIADRREEPSLGVWGAKEGEEGKFRFTMLSFQHDVKPPLPPVIINRVHSTNSLIDDDNFQGTATLDALDLITENVLRTLQTKHVGVRMRM